jgi:hypothetical protein
MPSPPPDPPPQGGPSTGPHMLRIRGMWGFGKRSDVRIDAADVVDLGYSPDNDPQRSMDASSRVFVPIEEDVEPGEGLAVRFGKQTLQPLGEAQWEVVTHDE